MLHGVLHTSVRQNVDYFGLVQEHLNLENLADECNRCGYLKVLHKELHREAAGTQEQELPNILNKNWSEYRNRVKPLMKTLKKVFHKEAEQGVILDGIE